jgi:hypothetical protein
MRLWIFWIMNVYQFLKNWWVIVFINIISRQVFKFFHMVTVIFFTAKAEIFPPHHRNKTMSFWSRTPNSYYWNWFYSCCLFSLQKLTNFQKVLWSIEMKWFILFNWIQSKVWHVFCHRLWHNLGITVVENLRKTYSTVVCLVWFEQNYCKLNTFNCCMSNLQFVSDLS